MSASDTVTLYHSPNSRSSAALTLLEELGAPYRLHVLNMKAGEQRQPAYLAINPMGKVPAVKHRDALITEQVLVHRHPGQVPHDLDLAISENELQRLAALEEGDEGCSDGSPSPQRGPPRMGAQCP